MPRQNLTKRQKAFIREMVRGGNGTQAAIRAGYARSCARQMAAKLVSNGVISAIIDAENEAVLTEARAEAVEMVSLGVAIAKSDVTIILHCESVEDFRALPAHIKTAIASVEFIDSPDGTRRVKFRMYDKVPVLDKMYKILGLYAAEKREVTHPDEPVGEVFVFLDPSHKP